MGERLRIPAGAWVLVGDGRKALILRNQGNQLYPNLKVQEIFHAPTNPRTSEQGTDKPVKTFFGDRHSAVEQTDWHDLGEHRFAEQVADALDRSHREVPIRSLVIVAPPRTLADLRRALPSQLKGVILAEVEKDLTKHPVHEIERHLTA